MYKQPEKNNNLLIPEHIIKALQRIKGMQGIILTGSRAVGSPDLHSDWDFIIVLASGLQGYRKTWKIKGDIVETFCHPEQELNEFLRTDPLLRIGATTHMLASGIIIKDTATRAVTKVVKRAQYVWKKGPRPVGKSERQWIGYDITTYMQDAADCIGDNNPAYILFAQAASEMVRYYYALAGVWMPLPKRRLEDLQKRMPALYALVVQLHIASEWQEKADIVTRLGVMLARQFKLTIDGELPAQKN